MKKQNHRSPFHRNPRNRAPRNQDAATEVFLYDEIGFWGIDAQSFVKELRGINAPQIDLRINSPGGNVFDGVAIMNAIDQHPAHVVAHIDGLAASMASGIAMAADEIVMSKGAFMMIHDPWSLVIGDADELRASADLLDNIGDVLAQNYADRSGRDDVRDLMKAETWMNQDEAVDMGFADRVAGDESAESNLFDLSIYQNVPAALDLSDSDLSDVDLEKALRKAGASRKQARDTVHAVKSLREADDSDQRDVDAFVTNLQDFVRQAVS